MYMTEVEQHFKDALASLKLAYDKHYSSDATTKASLIELNNQYTKEIYDYISKRGNLHLIKWNRRKAIGMNLAPTIPTDIDFMYKGYRDKIKEIQESNDTEDMIKCHLHWVTTGEQFELGLIKKAIEKYEKDIQ
jgi:hypothetical protein